MEGLGEQGAAGEEGQLVGAVAAEASPQALMGYSLDEDFIENLPLAVKYRVYALKKLQAKSAGLEAKYLREFHSIERKFAGIYGPLLEKRRQIINALYEPTKEECEVKSAAEDYNYNEIGDDSNAQMQGPEENPEYEDLEEYCEEDFEDVEDVFGEYGGIEGHNVDEEKEEPTGIPHFWLTVLKNVEEVSPLIQKYDEPILKLLRDVKVKFSKPDEPLAFTLEFHFEPNDYFTNEMLTKTYTLKSKLHYSDPHPFRGSAVEHCIGCKIDWKEGKNVTVQTVQKKQRHRFWGLMRTVTQEFPRESFFNFFSALRWGLDADEDEEDVFIAHTLRTFVIPRAVLYFTGEALETEQEGLVRQCNDLVYDKVTYENGAAAFEGAKGQCLDSQAEDIDR